MTTEEHRKLDAGVAEKVMGWVVAIESARGNKMQMKAGPTATRFRSCPVNGEWWENRWLTTDLPYYSTDIQAAWQVVEKMQKQSRAVMIIGRTGGGFWCTTGNSEEFFSESIESAPEAICKAALLAVKDV